MDRAFDLLVYAPIGLAIAAKEELPRLIARGRREAAGQVGMARVVGQFAVNRGQKEAGKLFRQVGERLAGLGLVPDPKRGSGPAPSSSPSTSASTAPAPPPEQAPPAPEPAPAGAPAGEAGSLAIPGYDSLSAPQVVQRLDGLSGDELEAVRGYEAATRRRKTILGRISQLQSGT